MEIILLEKVTNLGGLGDIVKVKDGYARKTRCGKTRRPPKNHPHRDARRAQPQSTRTPRQPPHSHHKKIRQAHHRHGLTGPCRTAAAHTLAATSRTPPSSRAEPHRKTPAPPGNTHTHTPTR